MTQPISVLVQGGAGYIRYSEAAVARTLDVAPTCEVAADLDAEGNVIGIEILDVVSPKQVAEAVAFAASAGLAFPRDIAGTLVAEPEYA